ncbi:hypothetical protein NDU88_002547 [Pleurodeles waltl]|uniref:Uncharacterized protein n=1 Tax=Pleurodeles waltl TaxID=8319 RepID=A0AAV7SDF5_PLEWA|nr:hypothetical protein NDU88_002547 [Pleurodeles waltl]
MPMRSRKGPKQGLLLHTLAPEGIAGPANGRRSSLPGGASSAPSTVIITVVQGSLAPAHHSGLSDRSPLRGPIQELPAAHLSPGLHIAPSVRMIPPRISVSTPGVPPRAAADCPQPRSPLGGDRTRETRPRVVSEGPQRLLTGHAQPGQSTAASPSQTSHLVHGPPPGPCPLITTASSGATTAQLSAPGSRVPYCHCPAQSAYHHQPFTSMGPASFATSNVPINGAPAASLSTSVALGSLSLPRCPWSLDPPLALSRCPTGPGPAALPLLWLFSGGLWQNPDFGRREVPIPSPAFCPSPGHSTGRSPGCPITKYSGHSWCGTLTCLAAPLRLQARLPRRCGRSHRPPRLRCGPSQPQDRAWARCDSPRQRSPYAARCSFLSQGSGPLLPRHFPRTRGYADGQGGTGTVGLWPADDGGIRTTPRV